MAGRPPFEPTEKNRGEVEALTIAGYTEPEIAKYIGCNADTLRKYFRQELDNSMPRLLGRVATTVARLALGSPAVYADCAMCGGQGTRDGTTPCVACKGSGKSDRLLRAEVPPNLGAACFLLKTRGAKMGWTVPRNDEEGGGGGGNMVIEITGGLPKQITASTNSTTQPASATQPPDPFADL